MNSKKKERRKLFRNWMKKPSTEITYSHTTCWESCSRCSQEFIESEINPGMCHCSEWLSDEQVEWEAANPGKCWEERKEDKQ